VVLPLLPVMPMTLMSSDFLYQLAILPSALIELLTLRTGTLDSISFSEITAMAPLPIASSMKS